MLNPNALADRLRSAFAPGQASVLTDVIWMAYNELVKASDLAELKEVVRELAEAQRRTHEKMGALAEAQQRTDGRVDSLAHGMQEFAQAMKETRREFGGVTASVSYELTRLRLRPPRRGRAGGLPCGGAGSREILDRPWHSSAGGEGHLVSARASPRPPAPPPGRPPARPET